MASPLPPSPLPPASLDDFGWRRLLETLLAPARVWTTAPNVAVMAAAAPFGRASISRRERRAWSADMGLKEARRPQTLRGRVLDRLYSIVTLGGRIPCVVLILYTVVGGLLFRYLERDEDERRRNKYAEASEWAVNQMLDRMLEVKCHDHVLKTSRDEQVKHAKDAIYWFLDHLNLTEVIAARSQETPWTMFGSMFYAGQLYTTIGYGIPTTQTKEGQMSSIFYILFGIPIFLVSLKQVGQSLSSELKRIYKRIRKNRQKAAKNQKGANSNANFWSSFKSKSDVENNNDAVMDEKEKAKRKAAGKLTTMLTQIPIAFGILVLWILASSCLFCIWETEWGLSTSVYFYFVSISTVGLGDIIPTNTDMFIINFVLILVGLFLLSMCLNLLQTLIENLWSLLIKEYICEMEVMAAEGKTDDAGEEAPSFEMGILGKIMRLPAVEHRSRGMVATAKSWMAERVATEVIAHQLESDPDSDSSSEEDGVEHAAAYATVTEETADELRELRVDESADRLHPPAPLRKTSRHSIVSGRTSAAGSSSAAAAAANPVLVDAAVLRNRKLFNRIQTLQRVRAPKDDFRSLVFSKFLASEQLQKFVEANDAQRTTETRACQTDIRDYFGGLTRGRHSRGGAGGAGGGGGQRPASYISTNTTSTDSFHLDEEHYYLVGYDDIRLIDASDSANSSPIHSILQRYLEETHSKRRASGISRTNTQEQSLDGVSECEAPSEGAREGLNEAREGLKGAREALSGAREGLPRSGATGDGEVEEKLRMPKPNGSAAFEHRPPTVQLVLTPSDDGKTDDDSSRYGFGEMATSVAASDALTASSCQLDSGYGREGSSSEHQDSPFKEQSALLTSSSEMAATKNNKQQRRLLANMHEENGGDVEEA